MGDKRQGASRRFLFGNDVFIGPNATFCNDRFPSTDKTGFDLAFYQKGHWAIVVKDGAAIGANCVVLPGVTIGAGALIAAGVVVTGNVPDRHILMRDGSMVPITPQERELMMATRMRFAS